MVRFLAGLTFVLATVCSCAGGGDGSTYRGEVSAGAEEGEWGNRWVVFVKLDGARVSGNATVQVSFDGTELACEDGRAVRPDEIEVGAEITFVRVGDAYDDMSPPIIGGRSVEVAC